MSLTLSGARRREIQAFQHALEEGAFKRLEKFTRSYGLPQKQEWRVDLWRSATGLYPGRVATTVLAWNWLREHGMTLTEESTATLRRFLMEKAPVADLSPLLDAFVGAAPVPDFDELRNLAALHRPDMAGLAWLYGRQVDLDPSGPKGSRFPTLQRVLENLGVQPATLSVIGWLLDHGVTVRTPPERFKEKHVSPLGTLINVLQHQDMSQVTMMGCAQQLWEQLEAAGDDPTSPGYWGCARDRLWSLPAMEQWYAGRALAQSRLAQAPEKPSGVRRRVRS